MQTSQLARLLIVFFSGFACAGKNPEGTLNDEAINDSIIIEKTVADSFPPGKVISRVICKDDPAQSYALYLPLKGNGEALPVLYFFDPHGDGSFPLGKYTALADKYNFILIGSNNSKNGNDWTVTEAIWNNLYGDSQKRLMINKTRIYTCGFSGGAKVAGYVGLTHHEVQGIIANGAGLPDERQADNFNFSFTALAGEGDMNMTDLVTFDARLDKTQTRHRIIFFEGKHEWAPKNAMNIAFEGLQLDAMHNKTIPGDDGFISNFAADSKKRIDNYLKENNPIAAEQECKLSVSMLDGLGRNANWFRQEDALLKTNAVYKKQYRAKQNLLASEQEFKKIYSQKFEQGDANYWSNTIKDLQSKATLPAAQGGMYQRLLAYLSLAFYSISNQMVKGNRNEDAAYFVSLYKMADSTNSEAWYLSAIVNARGNNANDTHNDLLKAVAYGFTDKNRMMQQPEFRNLGTQLNLTEIQRKMK